MRTHRTPPQPQSSFSAPSSFSALSALSALLLGVAFASACERTCRRVEDCSIGTTCSPDGICVDEVERPVGEGEGEAGEGEGEGGEGEGEGGEGEGEPAGPCAGGDDAFDDGRVYVAGPLEGNGRPGVAPIDDLAAYAVGFPGQPSAVGEAAIHQGALVYLEEGVARRFVADTHFFEADDEGDGDDPGDCGYPTAPEDNDVPVATPGCPDAARALLSSGVALFHRCNGGAWHDEAGAQVVPADLGSDVVAFAADGTALLDDILGSRLLPPGALAEILPPGLPDDGQRWFASRPLDDGFLVVIEHGFGSGGAYGLLELFELPTDGSPASSLGVYTNFDAVHFDIDGSLLDLPFRDGVLMADGALVVGIGDGRPVDAGAFIVRPGGAPALLFHDDDPARPPLELGLLFTGAGGVAPPPVTDVFEGPDPFGVCATLDGPFDIDDVFILGTLSEGSCFLEAFASVSDAADYAVGFGCSQSQAQVRSDGAVVYIDRESVPGDALRVFTSDPHAYAADRQEDGPDATDCAYPDGAKFNDPILPTPPCDGDRVFSFALQAGTTDYVYRCGTANTWFVASTGTALPAFTGNGRLRAVSATVALTDQGSVLPLDGGASIPLSSFVGDVASVARTDGTDGFFAALGDAASRSLVAIAADGTVTPVGDYGAPPAGVSVAVFGEVLATNGDLYVQGTQAGADVVIRFVVGGASTVVFDETTSPAVKLHISSLVSTSTQGAF